jgi:hypothetical protein
LVIPTKWETAGYGRDPAVEADRIACLNQPPPFHALGSHHHDFHQLADEEVLNMLQHPERGGEGRRNLSVALLMPDRQDAATPLRLSFAFRPI